jgi:hypothetical protein
MLKLREDIFDIDIDELYAHLKAHGVTIIQAHSHRAEKCVPHPHHVDGFEINCCLRKDNYNERTMQVAKEYGLPLTIGSDCHRPEDVGVSATLSEEKITSVEQYLELMRTGKLILSIGGGAL